MILDFVPIWTLILGLAVFFYVLLDGFDLGVGILYNFAETTAERNTLMNSIAPIWDGNETWLVLGGLGLLAAFPLAFAIIIPAVYFPILVMLLSLVSAAWRLNSVSAMPSIAPSGIMPSAMAPHLPLSRRGWCWAPSSRAFRWKGGISPAAALTASRPSRCSPDWRCCSAMACWEPAG